MNDPDDARIRAILSKAPTPTEASHVDDGRLVAYRARTVGEEELAQIEEHLARCVECRGLLAELAAPVAPELRARARDAARPARRSAWVRPVLALAAAAAIIGVFVNLPSDPALPSYALEGPLGGVASMRGDAPASQRFVPTSQVKFILRPDAAADERLKLFVFVDADDGQLTPAPGSGSFAAESGTFRYEVEARAIFGARYGERAVHLMVSPEPIPRALERAPLAELQRALKTARWFTASVDYQAELERQGEQK